MYKSQHIDNEIAEEMETRHFCRTNRREPLLRKHSQLPIRSIKLDVVSSNSPIRESPSASPVIQRVAKENYMKFYEPIPIPIPIKSIYVGNLSSDNVNPKCLWTKTRNYVSFRTSSKEK